MTKTTLSTVKNAVHLFAQGKGGILKSGCASVLSQYLLAQHGTVLAVDTDTENKTLCKVKALNGKDFTILNADNDIDIGTFDKLIEAVVSTSDPIVVDNGANSFRPLITYLRKYDVVKLLQEMGKKVVIHTVVAGGVEYEDTSAGAIQVAQATGDAPMVLWLNEFFGPLNASGVDYVDSPMFKAIQDRVADTVLLSKPDELVVAAIKKMNKFGLTIEEVGRSSEFALMEKQRLLRIWHPPIIQALDGVEFA